MGWIILIVIAYAPIVYKFNRRITVLEETIVKLEDELKRKDV